jgi:hypothetical protein
MKKTLKKKAPKDLKEKRSKLLDYLKNLLLYFFKKNLDIPVEYYRIDIDYSINIIKKNSKPVEMP